MLEPITYAPVIKTVTFTDSKGTYDVLNYDKIIYIDDSSTEQCSMNITANLYDSTSAKISVVQNDKTLYEETVTSRTGIVSCTYSGKLKSTFSKHENIYVYIESDKGNLSNRLTHIVPNAQLFTSKDTVVEDYEMSWGGKNGSITIPDTAGVLGGTKINMDLPNIPAQIILGENGKVYISFGLGKYDPKIESSEKYIERVGKEWDKAFNQYSALDTFKNFEGKGVPQVINSSLTADFKFMGLGSGTIQDGKVKVEVNFKALVNLNGSAGHQYIVGTIPLYLEFSYKAESCISNGLVAEFDLADVGGSFTVQNNSTEIGMEITIGLYGGVGIGKVLSVGPSGSGTLDWTIKLPEAHLEAYLSAMFGVELHAFCFHATYPIAEFPRTIIYDSKNRYERKSDSASAYSSLSSDDFKMESREYATETLLESNNSLLAQSAASVSSDVEQVISDGVYPYAQSKVVTVNDTEYLFRLADNSQRSNLNRTTLVCSIKNGSQWSEPVIISDDMTGDYYYDVCADGSNIYIAWTNSDSVILPGSDITAVTASTDITVAKLNTITGEITEIGTVGTSGTGDYMPAITVINGKGIVSWQSNSDNNIIQTTGKNTIYYSEVDSDTLSEITTYVSERALISSFDIGYINGECVVAFTEDTDGNVDSITDMEVFASAINGKPVQITDNVLVDSSVAICDGNLFWYQDGNIAYSSDIGSAYKLAFDVPELVTDNFNVSDTANGTVFSWQESNAFDSNLTNIVAAVFDDTFAEPVICNITEGMPVDVEVYSDCDGIINYISTFENGENYELLSNTQKEIRNIRINSIDFDYESAVSGAAIPVSISVTNTGNADITELIFSASGSGKDILFKTASDINVKPKETETIYTEMSIPVLNEYILFELSAEGFDDKLQFALGYTDLELTACKTYSGDNTIIDVNIANVSEISSASKLNVYIDGSIVSTIPVEEVSQGKYSAIALDYDSITNGDYSRVKLVLTSDKPELYRYNNVCEIANTIFQTKIHEEEKYVVTIPQNVTVTRNNSIIASGTQVSTGDVLTITANIPDGYALKSLKVNGKEISNSSLYIVSVNDVVITVDFVYIGYGFITTIPTPDYNWPTDPILPSDVPTTTTPDNYAEEDEEDEEMFDDAEEDYESDEDEENIYDEFEDEEEITISLDNDLEKLMAGKANINTKKSFFDDSATICLSNTEESYNAALMAIEELGEDNPVFYAFDISIFNEGQNDISDKFSGGYVTFKIPVPKSMAEMTDEISVYHIEDGYPEYLESEIIDDDGFVRIKFSVTEFSPFMFIVEGSNTSYENPDSDNDDENDDMFIGKDEIQINDGNANPDTNVKTAIIIPTAVIGCVLLLKKPKRKRHR